jgi:hypothetical protein
MKTGYKLRHKPTGLYFCQKKYIPEYNTYTNLTKSGGQFYKSLKGIKKRIKDDHNILCIGNELTKHNTTISSFSLGAFSSDQNITFPSQEDWEIVFTIKDKTC